mgnify:CR=1 FL=1|jgi:hypothetical protein
MNRLIAICSTYLFASSGYIGGAARLFDFQGSLNIYNDSPTEEAADKIALYCDWKAIGDDLRAAYNKYASEHGGHEVEQRS